MFSSDETLISASAAPHSGDVGRQWGSCRKIFSSPQALIPPWQLGCVRSSLDRVVTTRRSRHHDRQRREPFLLFDLSLQWEAVDAEIKVSSDENTELKGSPFKAWSRSVYCHACYAYCHGFLPCSLPFQSIHLHFSKTSTKFFLC